MSMQFIPFNMRIGLGWKRNVPWCVLSGVREMQVSTLQLFLTTAKIFQQCCIWEAILTTISVRRYLQFQLFSVRALLAV